MNDAGSLVPLGTEATAREEVVETSVASAWGSGELRVYATPAMVALVEKAAVEAVDSRLPEGWVTVGASVNIRHVAPTPVGMTVTARVEVIEVDGRRIDFRVRVEDKAEVVGTGEHSRYCVERGPFVADAQHKKRG